MAFNYTADKAKEHAKQAGNVLLTVVVYTVATVHTAATSAYRYVNENQDQIKEDLQTFWQAVVTGTKSATSTTLQLAKDARKQYDAYQPTVQEYKVKAVEVAKEVKTKVSDYWKRQFS